MGLGMNLRSQQEREHREKRVEETRRRGLFDVSVRQEERVPSWGSDGAVIRCLSVRDNREGHTFTVELRTWDRGPYADVRETVNHITLGSQHLDELIETLTQMRDDQAAEREREEAYWASQRANSEPGLSGPEAWDRVHRVLEPLVGEGGYRAVDPSDGNAIRVFVSSGDYDRAVCALADDRLLSYVDVRVGKTPVELAADRKR